MIKISYTFININKFKKMIRKEPILSINKRHCLICNTTFKYSNRMISHIEQEHKININQYYDTYLLLDVNEKKCVTCGKDLIFNLRYFGYQQACSRKCACKHIHTINYDSIQTKKQNTNLLKYGTTNVMQNNSIKMKLSSILKNKTDEENKLINLKRKQTKLIKYGNEKYTNVKKNKETKKLRYGNENFNNREKNKKTLLTKYNVDNISKLDSIKQKKINTLLSNYNVINPSQMPNHILKSKQTNNLKFNKDWATQNITISNKIKQSHFNRTYNNLFNITDGKLKDIVLPLFDISEFNGVKQLDYNFKCLKCNTNFNDNVDNGKIPVCPKCKPTSLEQKELETFLIELLGNETEIHINYRKLINPLEVDIYIPKYNIAIEYNGLYWHSFLNKPNINYHINKTNLCRDQNVQLIHIFSHEWSLKKEQVKHRLIHIFNKTNTKIYARKTVIKEIDNKEKRIFLEQFHLQGTDKSKIKLGAYFNNELVGVMTFRKPNNIAGNKKNNKLEYELSRFATKYNCIGLFSKMFSYFKKNYVFNSVYTYANRCWSDGNVYLKSNFKFSHNSSPNYYYTKDYVNVESRYKYIKSSLTKFSNYDKSKSEWEIMKENKYDKFYDCGTSKYEFINLK